MTQSASSAADRDATPMSQAGRLLRTVPLAAVRCLAWLGRPVANLAVLSGAAPRNLLWPGRRPGWRRGPLPVSDEALQTVLHKVIPRLMKLLTRRGVLIEEEGSTYMADTDSESDEARALRPLQAAASTYRIAFGPRAGHKVLTVQGAMPKEAEFKQNLCADIDGFSLHAAVRCGADERQALEQLCRYFTRPALANERVQTNAAGQVVLKLKTPWRDGTTHLVMSPLEFMQRLAALVPRPRLHLIRFHGVLAPNAKLRALVVPQGQDEGAWATQPAACEASRAHHRPARLSWARLLKARVRARPGALPELRRRAEDHRRDPGAAGHRKDPYAPGSAGPGAATGCGAWAGAASGLNAPKQVPVKAALRSERWGRLRPRISGTGRSGLMIRAHP